MRCVAAIAVGLLTASACQAARLEPQPPGPPPMCAIEVEFRERNTEIDMRTLDRVLAYVETAPKVVHAYDKLRRDGDAPTLCLVIPTADEALTVFERLVLLVPPNRGKLPRIKPAPPVLLRYNGVQHSTDPKGHP